MPPQSLMENWSGQEPPILLTPGSAMKVIKDLVKIVTKELEKENIIEQESK